MAYAMALCNLAQVLMSIPPRTYLYSQTFSQPLVLFGSQCPTVILDASPHQTFVSTEMACLEPHLPYCLCALKVVGAIICKTVIYSSSSCSLMDANRSLMMAGC